MRKKVFYVKEYFQERGPYEVLHVAKSGNVTYVKADETYCRHRMEGRLETRK